MTNPLPIEPAEKENLKSMIAESRGLLVLDFWAPWCDPCLVLLTILAEIAPDYRGRVRFAKFNVDDDPALSVAMGIRGVPTVIFHRDGVELERSVGTESPAALRHRLDRLLAEPG